VTFPAIAPGIELTRVDAIADPGAIVCYAGNTPLIVTRRDAAIAAFHNICPHAGYPLQRADGRIVVQEERYMLCGGHGASFVLDTGACAGGPCNGAGLTRIHVIVCDGVVWTA
jgi:nitrite reductase/ring-hydroxylating ferredoxin subunit